MNKYIITLEVISDLPPDWIVPSIEAELNDNESVTYFDYKIEEVAQ
jgi:hypothetical protein